MNWRIQFLKFIRTRPLLISVVQAFFVIVPGILGIAAAQFGFDKALHLKVHDTCDANIHLWLFLCIIRLALRLVCQCIMRQGRLRDNNNQALVENTMYLLDVFGMVWFGIGNLLVFDSFVPCAYDTPLVYAVAFAYLISCYIGFVVPMIVWCSLSPQCSRFCCCGTLSEEDRAWVLTQPAGMGLGLPPPPHTLREREVRAYDILPDETHTWETWLQGMGCAEVRFDENVRREVLKAHGNTENIEPDNNNSENSDITTQMVCSVCLAPFEMDDMVARYPCRGRHWFHAGCLTAWLHTSYVRHAQSAYNDEDSSDLSQWLQRPNSMNSLTCPCCREHPHPSSDNNV